MPSHKPHSFPCLAAYQTWLLGLLLVIAIVAVFGPAVHYDFVVWDDNLHVYANPRFQPVTWAHVRAFWQAPYARLYIPLTYTTWAAVMWLAQALSPGTLTAGPFHCLNLVLHVGSVLVVFRLGLLVLSQPTSLDHRVPAAAATGALLFGLHPLQVEAVAWVSGLRDVLCGWWSLVALWLYLESVRTSHRRQQWLYYGLATCAFSLALLAKPAAVVVPVIACLLATVGLGQACMAVARALMSWLGIALVWGLWAKEQQPDAIMVFLAPLWTRPVIAADTLTFYLGKLVWPISLGPDYGRTPQVVLEQGWKILQGFVPVGLGLIVWWGWRRLRWLRLAAGVFIVGLLPVLGFVPFIFQAISTVADRYVYLALLGPALGLGWGIRQIGRWKSVWVGLGLVCMLLGLCTVQQVRVWQNTVTLFTHALQVNPRSVLAHNNLGLALAQHGQLDAAITQYRAGLRINPNAVEAHYNLGNALQRQGQRAQAITHYTEAVRLKPHWVEAYNNLGNTLDDDGRADEAIAYYQAALRLQPDFAEAHNNLGTAWLKQGRLPEALEQFRLATHLKPTWAEAYYNLGLVFDRQGKAGEAIAAYWTAFRIRPGWPQVALPLAWLLVRQHPVSASAIAEAIALAEQACQATAYQDATALYVLAVAYQTAGDEARARTTAQHALSLATAAGNIPFSTRIAAEFLSTVQ